MTVQDGLEAQSKSSWLEDTLNNYVLSEACPSQNMCNIEQPIIIHSEQVSVYMGQGLLAVAFPVTLFPV